MDSDYIYRLHYAKFLSSRLTNFVPFSKKNQANKKVGLFNFQQEIIPTQKIETNSSRCVKGLAVHLCPGECFC